KVGYKSGSAIFCLFLILLFSASPIWAQSGIVQGKVVDVDGDVVPGATVELQPTKISTVTNQAGEYSFVDISAGTYSLRVTAYSEEAHISEIKVESGQTVNQNVTLQFKLKNMEQVVVTGTTTPEKKIESSTSISSLTIDEINDAAPRSTTEFLRRVPGFTRVESSGGEVNQNLAVRGLLGPESVSIEEDGIPVFPSMDNFFMNADNLVRIDENLEKVEILRSGSSPIFSSSTAGAIVNFLNKTGGSELHGTLKGTG